MNICARIAFATFSVCALGVASCNADIFDVEVALAPKPYSFDFGSAEGTLPSDLEADAQVALGISVLQDDGFNSKVQRRSVELVRRIDLAYAIPENTLTFDIPQIDVFVGPEGTQRFDDPGVAYVDSIRPVPAGDVTPLPTHHLSLEDQSAAHALIEEIIVRKDTFVLLLAMSTRLTAGQPIPAGQLAVEIYPHVRLGLPRD